VYAEDTGNIWAYIGGTWAKIYPQATGGGGGESAQLLSNRRININGNMTIAQTGTSFPAASAYVLDNWFLGDIGNSEVLVEQVASTVPEFTHSLKVTVTTASGAIAAGDRVMLRTAIEGYDARRLIGAPFVVGFWVSSAKAGLHCVAFRNKNNTRSYITTYTINAANTDEFKSVTVPVGLLTGDGWDYTSDCGVEIVFPLMTGANWLTADTDTWKIGALMSTAGQVNVCDTIGNVFSITGVQVELGLEPTQFEHFKYPDELRLCQRYYIDGSSTYDRLTYSGDVTNNGYYTATKSFSVPMCRAPLVVGTDSDGVGFPVFNETLISTPFGFQETRRANATTSPGKFTTAWVAIARI
jgi:hypothetical protein